MTTRDRILGAIEKEALALAGLARRIHANPELRFAETKASAWLSEAAGRASRSSPSTMRSPRSGTPAVTTSLPAVRSGPFIGLASVANELPGEVILLGTPAEEGGGGKIKLLEADAFAGLDAAIMFHPLDRDLLAHGALASEWVTFRFTGRASHAVSSPWDGNSARRDPDLPAPSTASACISGMARESTASSPMAARP